MKEQCLQAGVCQNPENCTCNVQEATVVAEQGMFAELADYYGVNDPTNVKIG